MYLSDKHPEMEDELSALAKQRERRLKDAEMVKTLRMREIEALYKFETQAAEDEYSVC